ncbi:MAG: replicative DNA helicase [Clostridia bacterium]|nr:replicative DNA helicase [Clostridia bacterium]
MDKKTKLQPRSIPNNIEAEQSILGCNLLDDNVAIQIMSMLKPEDFYTEAHKTIFEAMTTIHAASKPIDYVTLTDELERMGALEAIGGIDYITTLTNVVPSSANYKHYADIVKRTSLMRKLIRSSQEIIEKAYEGQEENILGFAEKTIFDISEQEDFSSLVAIGDTLDDVLNKFEEIDKNGGQVRGITTGLESLDKLTGGLQRSDLILLAARPSVGKTSLAMNIVNNAALLGKHKVAVFSLEMPKEQITQRTLCSVSGVSMEKALKGKLQPSDWSALWEGSKKLSEAKIYIDDSSMNTSVQILSKCRRLKREQGGLDLVMIDYLQLMSPAKKSKDSNRQNEVAEITRNLKIAARELQVPIILLSQLSRDIEKREGHEPVLSDLRESGAIEQDADIVMFIHNPSRYGDLQVEDGPNICELIVAKHRNGSLAKIKLKWIPEITTFVDVGASSDKKSLEQMAPPPPPPPAYADQEIVMQETDGLDEFDF